MARLLAKRGEGSTYGMSDEQTTTDSALRWSDKEAARTIRESYGAVVPGGSTGVADNLYTADELSPLPPPAREMALGLGNLSFTSERVRVPHQ